MGKKWFFPGHKSKTSQRFFQFSTSMLPSTLCTNIESPHCFEENKVQLDPPEIRNTAGTMNHIKIAFATIRDAVDGPRDMSIEELDCMVEQALSLLTSTMETISYEDGGHKEF